MGTVREILIIHPPVVIHFMEGPFMGASLGQAVVVSRGAEAVAEGLVAGEDSVVGGSKLYRWHGGLRRNPGGRPFLKANENLLRRLTNDQSRTPVIRKRVS
jgi:hypothetical protein